MNHYTEYMTCSMDFTEIDHVKHTLVHVWLSNQFNMYFARFYNVVPIKYLATLEWQVTEYSSVDSILLLWTNTILNGAMHFSHFWCSVLLIRQTSMSLPVMEWLGCMCLLKITLHCISSYNDYHNYEFTSGLLLAWSQMLYSIIYKNINVLASYMWLSWWKPYVCIFNHLDFSSTHGSRH